MASIGPVNLQIFVNNPSPGMALVEVEYVISATLDDVQSGQSYREHVQLFNEVRTERLVPGGTLWDAPVVFTANAVSFVRSLELRLPVAALEQGVVSPVQPDPIKARVTLSPLPAAAVTQDSNTVNVNQPPIVVGTT